MGAVRLDHPQVGLFSVLAVTELKEDDASSVLRPGGAERVCRRCVVGQQPRRRGAPWQGSAERRHDGDIAERRRLDEEIAVLGPALAALLGLGGSGRTRLDWIAKPE